MHTRRCQPPGVETFFKAVFLHNREIATYESTISGKISDLSNGVLLGKATSPLPENIGFENRYHPGGLTTTITVNAVIPADTRRAGTWGSI